MGSIALLVVEAWGKIQSRHTLVAVVDWISTLPFEVELIWPTKWNIVKVLYILNRYFLIDLLLHYPYHQFGHVEACRIGFIVSPIVTLIGISLAEAVIFIRLYAISVTACCLTGLFVKSVVYTAGLAVDYRTCLPNSEARHLATATFGLLMANETIALLATPPDVTLNAASSIVNIVLLLSLTPTASTMFVIPQRVIHSVLASRMILHLREHSYYEENGYTFEDRLDLSTVSALAFRAHQPDS
ncbi:hypothetical protein EST38_g7760 [Candolleomyces aberdarensis]|uniref:DUF6533 domain-containing protein n=1 Tax=Candolleomyces aberdarensis TaxID=2316362 RepID=A0A4Q2DEE1_9AGAR|nr:hypothetical protein EST38_g7760 [Candolleomyces aberdarensis]